MHNTRKNGGMAVHLLSELPGEATGDGRPAFLLQSLDQDGREQGPARRLDPAGTAAAVESLHREDPTCRFVWEDTRTDYAALLAQGVRISRCHDLGLAARALGPWPRGESLLPPRPELITAEAPDTQEALFSAPTRAGTDPATLAAEYRRQLTVLTGPGDRAAGAGTAPSGRALWLLAGLDSAGALAAEEMHAEGIPWDPETHEAMLAEVLGPRVPAGTRPQGLQRLVTRIREALDAPELNPESQPELLRALHRAGIEARSTRKQDLEQIRQPVGTDLLEYRKLSRLHSANGWAWLDTWVRQRRFHPTYDVAAVVSGRWGGHGGGVQQLPREIRTAVRADPGHVLVVADASQLEPRVLAAISGDRELAAAAADSDLYAAIAARAFDGDRKSAKVAMLGAMYGGTTGLSAAMAPRLAGTFPTATAFLERAARSGERGERVRTWLGRTSPAPGPLPDDAGQGPARLSPAARAQGRFTRNFVVQGTASEWAAAWLATLRTRLHRVAPEAHQVLFLHDEIMVHAPSHSVEAVRRAMVASAAEASRLLFGAIPVDFPVDVGQGADYATAKG